MKDFLVRLLGTPNVKDDADTLAAYSEDFTEIDPAAPSLVALVENAEQVQAVVAKANEASVPITPCVYRTNVGGLAIPTSGGIILDMTRMNRIIEVDVDDMYAVIEPGVTQQLIKDHLAKQGIELTLGYSLAPPATSIFANALLGGLTNRSLKYGDQSMAISGLEVVLADGSLVKLGSWAQHGAPPFGLVPFPNLTGLFTGWQGTTGIATRMAYQLWPKHRYHQRLFVLAYGSRSVYEAMRRLCRTEVCDDIGGLSWPSAKMMMGVKRPHPVPSPGEPTFFLYIDLTAELPEELRLKARIVASVLEQIGKDGHKLEPPLDVETIVRVNPAMGKFADFPTELDFLTNHGGGGLTWMGTYGPLSRMTEAAEAGIALMVDAGIPPTIVSRPMRGGHYGVLRFISTFDKKNTEDVTRVKALNRKLLALCLERGFVMYKTPAWAWREMTQHLDPGMVQLLERVKKVLDPKGIMNPGKLGL